MATFVSSYISDLSPVKDNIKLPVCILRAWLQPLYNKQQVKNIEMIAMYDHHINEKIITNFVLFMSYADVVSQVIACEDLDNYDKKGKAGKNQSRSLTMSKGSEIKFTLWGDYAQQFNDFLYSCDDHDMSVLVLQFAIMKFWDGKMCIQNGYWGTKLYLFDGNKAIYEDEYKEVEEFRQRLFANQPSEQSKNTATKISTASKNSTKDNFVNRHPIRNIAELLDVEHVQTHMTFRLQIRVQDETWTMSLSLFNDEVQAMVGRSAYQVAIDDYNVKKLSHVFLILCFSNDQEIIKSVLACATPIKTFRSHDNKATSNTVPTITLLDLESKTDENTTPNEKQKTNKRPAEGEQRSESSTGKKKAVEIKVEKDA
nr:nucleic acid-binding, OB-fold protein [Tanacetum cinerariifolium]